MHLTRRQFIANTGLLIAGLPILQACGSTSSSSLTTSTLSNPPFSAILGSFDHVAGIEQRLMVGVVDLSNKVAEANETVTIQFGPTPEEFTSEIITMRGNASAPADGANPYFTTRFTFPQDPAQYTIKNSWFGKVSWRDKSVVLPIPVTPANQTLLPIPGQQLRSVATPTLQNPLGVDPFCTRAEGLCPFHTMNLEDAIKSTKPTMLLFATPARCTSKFCGPELETVVSESIPYRDRINFIHVEIFQRSDTDEKVDAVNKYGMVGEPIAFFADASNMITGYIAGSLDEIDLKFELDRIAKA